MLDALFSALRTQGGFSFSLMTQSFAERQGYAVSAHKDRETILFILDAKDRVNIQNAIARFVCSNLDLLLSSRRVLGAWIEDGALYLDVATICDSEETARLLAIEHNQKAYFDLAKGVTVYV